MLESLFGYNLFDEEIENAILNIPLRRFGGEDRLIWMGVDDGYLTVKSACLPIYLLLGNSCSDRLARSRIWFLLWSFAMRPCIKLFLSKLLYDIVPNVVALQRCGNIFDQTFRVCGAYEDSSMIHIFFKCMIAKKVWNALFLQFLVFLQSLSFEVLLRLSTLIIILLCSVVCVENRNTTCFDYKLT